MSLNVQNLDKLDKVLSIYDSLKTDKLYDDLQLEQDRNQVIKLSNDILGTKFKIGVIGEFSTGKSTMINTFIQKELLPIGYKPTTNQITIVKDSKKEYVRIKDDVDSTLALTPQNILNLNKKSTKHIEIGVPLPNLSKYEIYDTPGVNDPSMFSDEIVFDLIGEVDVVIFVMHAMQVLKSSEIDFLTKLIRKKDIGKFFFVINQSDLIEDEKYEVKDDFLEKLSYLLHINKSQLSQQTYLYSAKNAMIAINNNDSVKLRDSGYDALISGIDTYISNNKKELFEGVLDRALGEILQNTILKIDTMLDRLNNKDKEYANTLENIQKEIRDFQIEIEDAINDFKRKFNIEKHKFIRDIKQSFDAINNRISAEIATAPIEKLSQNRYIEIRTKKLIEDATEEELSKFVNSIKINLENFDNTIKPKLIQKNIVINDMVAKNYASTVVETIAVGGAVVGAVAYTPTVLTITGGGIALSALGTVASSFIPGVGGIVAGILGSTISIAGTLAIQAGKVAFDLAKWGVKGIGEAANKIEDIAKVKQYQKRVKQSIDAIKTNLVKTIETEINPDAYIEAYINEKFPQKNELEQKIELAKKEFEYNTRDSDKIKSKLTQIKNSFLEYLQ